MAGELGLNDVSEEDIDRRTGEKSKLKTGNLKRSYNMPGEACKKYKGKEKQDCLNYRGRFAKFAKGKKNSKKEQSSVSYG
jgi:hypothetical protein